MSVVKDKINSTFKLQSIKKRILLQAMIALSSVALIAVLIFSMTAAWYTNVAKTSSMIFKAESWGFDEENISIGQDEIAIAPGMSAVLPISVDNSQGDSSVRIRVNFSKTSSTDAENSGERDTSLEKRVFFYADTAKTYEFGEGENKSSETVSKIYLGASETNSYSYTILPGNVLSLKDEAYNDVPIYWECVYDMLGYYFYGTVDNETVTATEYIRPIEYDYDKAVFGTDSENTAEYGQLISVDGKAKEVFLKELSANDGYEGQINVENVVSIGNKLYYPVQIDADNYGVWAYLCTYSEIEEGIAYDSSASNKSLTVTVKLTAFNVDTKTETVSTVEALNNALNNPEVDVVSLENAISVTSPMQLGTEVDAVLDLNGYSLSYTGSEAAYNLIKAEEGSSLTIMNGELVGNGKGSDASNRASMATMALQTTGADVVLSHVKVRGFDGAIKISDESSVAEDSYVQLIDCDFETVGGTLLVKGNAETTSAKTRVLIEDSTLISTEYMPVVGNGSNDKWGTDIVIENSVLNGYYAGVYQPQRQSSMYISGCTISGNTGICLKGGKMTVVNSTVTGTGAQWVNEPANAGSGFTDTGDGIYVEAVYDWTSSLILEGDNNVVSEKAYAVDLYGVEDKGPASVVIKSGVYKGAKGAARSSGIGTFEIYGGTFEGNISEHITRYDQAE